MNPLVYFHGTTCMVIYHTHTHTHTHICIYIYTYIYIYDVKSKQYITLCHPCQNNNDIQIKHILFLLPMTAYINVTVKTRHIKQ